MVARQTSDSIILRVTYWREGLESRFCEQITLKQPHTRIREPPILLLGFHSFSNHVNPEFEADLSNGANNSLTRPVAFNAAHERHVEFDQVWLEIREQV